MDVCSPYVVIRMLGLIGLILMGSGLYFNQQRDRDQALVVDYNNHVSVWSNGARAEFDIPEFQLHVARPGLAEPYVASLIKDVSVADGSAWMIPRN
eukprot:COSAG05_NODE_15378_length_371_cov_0.761029_1_plen_95_part_01